VRQLAAAFKIGMTCPFFKGIVESGSKLPHSKGEILHGIVRLYTGKSGPQNESRQLTAES